MFIFVPSMLMLWSVEYVLWPRRYSAWCTLLNNGRIRWVKVAALRRWSRTRQRIPRMQDLADGDYDVFAHGTWEKDRRRFVISHAWLAEGHPDPSLQQLHALVSELDRLGAPDSDVVFYDYASIPQKDRTPAEELLFLTALRGMNLLYTLEGTRVLVIPQVPEISPNPMPYSERGWCSFEVAISAAYDTVHNYKSIGVEMVLDMCALPLSMTRFREAFATKEFTFRGDREKVQSLYDQFIRSLRPKRMWNLMVEGLTLTAVLVDVQMLVAYVVECGIIWVGSGNDQFVCRVLVPLFRGQ